MRNLLVYPNVRAAHFISPITERHAARAASATFHLRRVGVRSTIRNNLNAGTLAREYVCVSCDASKLSKGALANERRLGLSMIARLAVLLLSGFLLGGPVNAQILGHMLPLKNSLGESCFGPELFNPMIC